MTNDKTLFDDILKMFPRLDAFIGSIAHKYEAVSLLNIILGLSVTLLLIVVLFVNRRFDETNDNFKEVSTVNGLITQTSDIETHFFEVGTKIRATLANNGSIHDSLRIYRQESTDEIGKIRHEWIHHGGSTVILDSIEIFINKRFELWDNFVKTNAAFGDSSHIVASNKIFADLLRLTENQKADEYKVLRQYMQGSERGIKMASVMVMVITLFSVSLILFAFLRINREVKRGRGVSAQLENKVRELDRSNQQLERFAYVASHDLHDPLRKLNVFSEHLEQKEHDRLSTDGKVLIKRIQRLVGQMQQLIDGLLDLSLNYQRQDKKEVYLNRILDDIRQNLSMKIQEVSAVIHSSSLPVIKGYESQLKQLFQNLISNSMRYAKKEVAPRIDINCSTTIGSDIPGVKNGDKQKKFYKLSFIDNGIGFDNKYAENIFIIFQRLHGKSEYPGSGIGLATCKLIVENHEGYITASGRVNEGAEFVVYLPV